MKSRNILILLLVTSLAAFIVITYFNVRRSEQHRAFSPVIIPYSYSFTDQPEGIGNIDIRFFLDSANGKFSNKMNYASMEIVAGEHRFRVDWAGDIIMESESSIKWRGVDLYSHVLPICFYLSSGIEMSDAFLEIQWINGTTDRLYLGNLSFNLVSQSQPFVSPLASAMLNPVGRIGSHDLYELAALCLELDLTSEIVLSEIDLGLTNYGLNTQNILHFHGNDIQTIRQNLEQKTIFDDFDDYDINLQIIPANQITTEAGNLNLPAGKNLLIIPLTTTTDDVSINCTGLRVVFTAGGEETSVIVSQKKLFDQVYFSETALEHLIKP